MEQLTIAKRNNPFRRFGRRALQSKYLILMILPAIVFYAIFNYLPMYGIVLPLRALIQLKVLLPHLGLASAILKKYSMILISGQYLPIL